MSLPLAVAGFFYAYLAAFGCILLGITSFGPVLFASALTGAWRLGAVHRWLAARLLGVMVTTPEGVRRRPGISGWVTSNLRDAAAWRTLVYLFLKGPLGIAEAVTVVVTWGYGLAYLSHPLWRPMAGPYPTETDGYPILIGDFPFGGWSRPFLNPVLGAVMLVAAPWAVRAVLLLDMTLLRWLLGPTASARRIRHLEETRTHAVEESAERLRRIERDLHDGAQVRLVTLAMHLGAAKERLARLPEVDPALDGLISGAHQNAKDALVELRSLVRGIHPPILDNGLDAALTTLAASGTVPVRLRVTLPERPTAVIESIAYFCTAELLANVAKHSGARQAAVTVSAHDGVLRIAVHDDGAGGGHIRRNGGLAGLAERLGTVDGQLMIHSPPGGPTVVTVELPLHL